MRKKNVLLIVSMTALLVFSVFGCGSKKNTDTSEDNHTTADTSDADGTDTETSAGDDENEEYLDNFPQTPPEEIQGEGTPDKEMPELEKLDTASLGQEYAVTDESGTELFTLQINKAELTKERDENAASSPEKVVVISYTFTNNGSEPLLVDDMSFKLIDGDTVCTPYYAAFLSNAEPAAAGESGSGQIAFAADRHFSEGTLVYMSITADGAVEQVAFPIEV